MRIHVERGKEAPGGGRHVREEVPTDTHSSSSPIPDLKNHDQKKMMNICG